MIKLLDENISIADKIILFLITMIPMMLITGPFLPDLSVVIASLFFLYLIFMKKIKINYNNKYIYLFILFYFICLISSLLSSDPLMSLESSLFYFRFYFFPFVFLYLLIKLNDYFLKNIFYILIISLLVVFVSVYYEAFNDNFFEHQYSGVFGNEQKSGSFISRFYPLIIGLTVYFNYSQKTLKLNFSLIFIFVLSSLVIIISGERTSFLLFAISNFLFFLFIKSLRKFFIYVSIFSIIVIAIFSQTIFKNSFDRIIFDTYDQIIESKNFSSHYKGHYTTALNMFKKNISIGVGPKLFRKLCNRDEYKHIWNVRKARAGPTNQFYPIYENSCATHPHNSYLQLLAEVGIFGFSFLVLLLFGTIYSLFKLNKIKPRIHTNNMKYYYLYLSSLICVFITLFPFIPNGSFFNNWVNVIYYFPLGLLMYSNHQLNKNKNLTL